MVMSHGNNILTDCSTKSTKNHCASGPIVCAPGPQNLDTFDLRQLSWSQKELCVTLMVTLAVCVGMNYMNWDCNKLQLSRTFANFRCWKAFSTNNMYFALTIHSNLNHLHGFCRLQKLLKVASGPRISMLKSTRFIQTFLATVCRNRNCKIDIILIRPL